MKGRVIYSSGGNYKVLLKNNIYFSRPLGKFRNEKTKILVGDIVEIKINENKEGLNELNVITKVYDRKNKFDRPNIANIDFAILVTSINEPKLNDFYLDKMITIFQSKGIEPILIFTKSDLKINNKDKDIINEYINMKYKCLIINDKLKNNDFLKESLHKLIKNKFCAIVGQTGVGKSTLINLLNKKFNLKTQEISKALGRGRHTTRHLEAFEVFKNSFIVDTPGFSSLEINYIDKKDIYWNFLNFEKYAEKCKFNNCSHTIEPGCNVLKKVDSKRIIKNYLKLINEIK